MKQWQRTTGWNWAISVKFFENATSLFENHLKYFDYNFSYFFPGFYDEDGFISVLGKESNFITLSTGEVVSPLRVSFTKEV